MYQCRRSITYKSKLKYETPFQDGMVDQSLGDLIFSNTGMVFQECKGPLRPSRLLVNKRVIPHRFIRQSRKLDMNQKGLLLSSLSALKGDGSHPSMIRFVVFWFFDCSYISES